MYIANNGVALKFQKSNPLFYIKKSNPLEKSNPLFYRKKATRFISNESNPVY
jgi:hypothetical protein